MSHIQAKHVTSSLECPLEDRLELGDSDWGSSVTFDGTKNPWLLLQQQQTSQ